MPEAAIANARTASPAQLEERYASAAKHAEAAMQRAATPQHAPRLLAAARTAATAGARVVWLQRAASDWAKPLEPHSACRRGCSHCCHIAVAMTDVEARVIGRAIGREPAPVADARASMTAMLDARLPGAPPAGSGYAAPCPFLSQGACSIYEHRPLACRTQINMDVDDYLCALREDDVPVSVPYADATTLKLAYVLAQPAARWADIRAFFPSAESATP